MKLQVWKERGNRNGGARVCEVQAELISSTLPTPVVKDPIPVTAKVKELQPQQPSSERPPKTQGLMEELKAGIQEVRQMFSTAMETTANHAARSESTHHPDTYHPSIHQSSVYQSPVHQPLYLPAYKERQTHE